MLIRVTPDVKGETHEKISTGQANSKFGFSMVDVGEAVARVGEVQGLRLRGIHAHIGSQLLDLDPFRREVAEFAKLSAAIPGCEIWDLGGGLGVRYVDGRESPPEIEEYVTALSDAVRASGAPKSLQFHKALQTFPASSPSRSSPANPYPIPSQFPQAAYPFFSFHWP